MQYYISNPPVQPWADCLDPIFRAGLGGRIELYVSTVVVSEFWLMSYFANRYNAGYDPELDLLAIINRHFQILRCERRRCARRQDVFGETTSRRQDPLKTPDALIGATSLQVGIPCLSLTMLNWPTPCREPTASTYEMLLWNGWRAIFHWDVGLEVVPCHL